MNDNFYFKISLLIIAAFFVGIFGSQKEKTAVKAENPASAPAKSPAALSNFTPPKLAIFKESENIFPKRDWSAPFLELQAQAALAISVDGGRVYYNKNIETQRPIASLTKLMTAIVVLENYDLDKVVRISSNAVKREGIMGYLKVNEEITARSLLGVMLIDSSNDAAFALAEQRKDFIFLMNKKAEELGLKNTHFSDPDGLNAAGNYSSAIDVSKIFGYLINKHPEAFEILKTKNMVVYSSNGKIEHRLENTNELLGANDEVIAGKTGYTDNAGGCLALLIKGDIITVVLGSSDRFGESGKIIKWLKSAYIWEK
ncbi:D-alanyl-D-alanine carboxypeptidase [Candidatus Wolfebacteria bacterium]|nr:D-alanyl-D-alanine carboxypeptidase [Candidatus Wolfebacteria bacterium]